MTKRFTWQLFTLIAILLASPAAHAQTGACCFGDESCIVLSAGSCATLAGQYQGDNSLCGSVVCDGFGFCCFAQGGPLCQLLTEQQCLALNGAYQGNVPQPTKPADVPACDPNRVPSICTTRPFPGACCLPDGTCQNGQTFDECKALGGVFQGFASQCAGVNCIGACCLPDCSCVPALTMEQCRVLAGAQPGDYRNFQGIGSDCATRTAAESATKGTKDDPTAHRGGGYSLPAASCPAIFQSKGFETRLSGLGNQILLSFEPFDDLNGCRKLTKVTIVAYADTHSLVTICNELDKPIVAETEFFQEVRVNDFPLLPPNAGCPPLNLINEQGTRNCNPIMLGSGQCCDFDSPISFANQLMCDQPSSLALYSGPGPVDFDVLFQGEFSNKIGLGTFSASSRVRVDITLIYEFEECGACCLPDCSCVQATESECTAQGGSWLGCNTSCSPSPCTGLCCLADGSCVVNITPGQCATSGGTFFCHGVCGPSGACCLPDGSCLVTSQFCCETTLNGAFFPGQACGVVVACCLPDGTCIDRNPVCCADEGGTPGSAPCGAPAACCFASGVCEELTQECCAQQGGVFQGAGTTCSPSPCAGACCLCDGTCVSLSQSACDAISGAVFQGAGVPCSPANPCPPTGACCVGPTCFEGITEHCCELAGGIYLGDAMTCTPINPCVGACCLFDPTGDVCIETTEAECAAVGEFQGPATLCSMVQCTGACCLIDGTCVEDLTSAQCTALGGVSFFLFQPCSTDLCAVRGGCSEKGSLLFWSKIELRWDAASNALKQDTYVTLNNDYAAPVRVKLFFINADNCTFLNVAMLLTANEPIYWKASTGMPQLVPPFSALGPGQIVGNERVLRGYIVGWAVNSLNQEIRWNHLSGGATIVNHAQTWAWEYTSCAFQALNVPHGQQTGDPGIINLNGIEFETCGQFLLYDFWADGEQIFNVGGVPIRNFQDLTLHPVSVDLRQANDGPVLTKADVLIWNENEFKVSGARRCIVCWDQAMLSEWGTWFDRSNLQTDKGRARIDGVAHNTELLPPVCYIDFNPADGLPIGSDPRDLLSVDAALLGLSTKFLTFGADAEPRAAAGTHLVWTGKQAAVIRYQTFSSGPPESPTSPNTAQLLQQIDDLIHERLTGETRSGE